jgi:hypothetical protein
MANLARSPFLNVIHVKQQAANVHRGTYEMALDLANTTWFNYANTNTYAGHVTFKAQTEYVDLELVVKVGTLQGSRAFKLDGESCWVEFDFRPKLRYQSAYTYLTHWIDAGNYTVSRVPLLELSQPESLPVIVVGNPDLYELTFDLGSYGRPYIFNRNYPFGTGNVLVYGMWYSEQKPADVPWQTGTMFQENAYYGPSGNGRYLKIFGSEWGDRINARSFVPTSPIVQGVFSSTFGVPTDGIRWYEINDYYEHMPCNPVTPTVSYTTSQSAPGFEILT